MFHLLFLIVFLLPYLGRAIYWRGVNEAQSSLRAAQVAAFPILEQAMSTLEDLAVGPTAQGELEELWRERGLDLELLPAGREVLQEAARRQRVQFRESVRARAIMPLLELGPCLRPSAECDSPQPLWRPLLGLHRTEDHWLLRYLAVILIVYNLFRGAFTWHVSRLRDAEERDGFSPRLQQYIRVYYAHAWGLQFLPWAAITAALFRVAEWLFLTDVILPSA